MKRYPVTGHTRVFPEWNGYSMNLGNLINHSSMNWGQSKDPLCYLCLAGSMVTSWSLSQEVANSNSSFNYKYFFAHSVKLFRENQFYLVPFFEALTLQRWFDWKLHESTSYSSGPWSKPYVFSQTERKDIGGRPVGCLVLRCASALAIRYQSPSEPTTPPCLVEEPARYIYYETVATQVHLSLALSLPFLYPFLYKVSESACMCDVLWW